MKRFFLGIASIVFLSAIPITSATFNDVPAENPDAIAINYLQSQGIVSGSEDGQFHPELGLTRCELTKIALKTANITVITPATSTFPDISVSSWCHAYASTARSHGIVSGYPDGTFKPNNKVSEIEALKIILNSLSAHLPSVTVNLYQDVHATDWWSPYIQYVKDNSLTPMPTGTYYGINHEFLRNKMARVLYRGLLVRQSNAPTTAPIRIVSSPTPTTNNFEADLLNIDGVVSDLNNLDISGFNF